MVQKIQKIIVWICLMLCLEHIHPLVAWKVPVRIVQTSIRANLKLSFSQASAHESFIKPIVLVVPIDENAQLENLQQALRNMKFNSHFITEQSNGEEFVNKVNDQDPYNNIYILDAKKLKESDKWLQMLNSIYFWFDYNEHESHHQQLIRHLCRYSLFLSTKDDSGFAGAEDSYIHHPRASKTTSPNFLYAKHFHNYLRMKRLIKRILMMHEYHSIDRNGGECDVKKIISSQLSSLPPVYLPEITSITIPNPPETSLPHGGGLYSHFLSLVYDRYSNKSPLLFLKQLRQGIDAWEIRVDLFHPDILASEYRLMQEITWLQSISSLPIIFTVRTMNQLGQFPEVESPFLARLHRLGLQLGVDYLDLEANLPRSYLEEVIKKVSTQYPHVTKVIGSYHTREAVSETVLENMFEAAHLQGSADIVKVVTGATSLEDNIRIQQVGERMANKFQKPFIGVCMQQLGAQSRILNRFFTPVTHTAFTIPAAPGQLTVKQIISSRINQQLMQSKQYYLFGNPIQHSLSPLMHSWAFEALQLPHRYTLNEQTNVTAYIPTLQSADFGGASVTIPFKEQIIEYLDGLHVASKAIGAVNTIVPVTEEVVSHDPNGQESVSMTCTAETVGKKKKIVRRRLIGYNTDWLGMYKPIQSLLLHKPSYRTMRHSHDSVEESNTATTNSPLQGLVIGAGGTARAACYTMQQLGLEVIIANRQYDKALLLANQFGGKAIPMNEVGFHPALRPKDLQVVISTVPPSAKMTLPVDLYVNKPVVLDVVYKPAKTPLLLQALAHDCHIVQGATMLLEQATEQFRLWQQRIPPREEMMKAVFSDTEKIDSL